MIKCMKKLFAIAVLAATIFSAAPAFAQVAIHAGYSPEAWTTNDKSMNFNSYFAGVDFQVPVVAGLGISLGAQGRWSVESGDEDSRFQFDTNHRTNLVAAEIPVMVYYNFQITDNISIAPFAGPKFAYYFKGRTRNASGHPIYEWFDEENDVLKMNRFGVSGTVGLSVGFQQFHVYGGYSKGLTDMDNVDNTETNTGGAFFGLMFGF